MLLGNRIGVGLTPSTISPTIPSLFLVKGAMKERPYSSDADQATFTASSWMENPTNKDGLLLKNQLRITSSVLSRAAGRALSSVR